MFIVSKIAGLILMPSMLLVLLGLIGLWRARNFRGHGRKLLALSLFGLLAIGLLPLGEILVRPLEQRFPLPDATAVQEVHTIVLLGGAVETDLTANRRVLTTNAASERLTETLAIMADEPSMPLIISGGSGSLWSNQKEAPLIRDWLLTQGIERSRIIVDDDSRNTYENAINTLEKLKDHIANVEHSRLLIVTSAAHMPRAIGCFRQAAKAVGLEYLAFTAWPVDYRSTTVQLAYLQPLGAGLADFDAAAREWLGLAIYYLLGRTPSLFPAPDEGEGKAVSLP